MIYVKSQAELDAALKTNGLRVPELARIWHGSPKFHPI